MRPIDDIRSDINNLVEEFYNARFAEKPFKPGISPIPVSGKVTDAKDIQTLVDSCLDGWFTTGRYNVKFEQALSKYIGVKHALTVNSGSSANLVAVSTLTDHTLGDRAIKPGDEMISVAVSFPTTLNPWLTYGVVPVFLDMDIPTYNIDVTRLEEALSPKTKAVMVAHSLGNPFDVKAIAAFCKKHNLWLIEDCCDALGATVDGQHVGTFGDMGTLSFYPAHHITMGEGGAVFMNNDELKVIAESFRDWGRDCYCDSGKDNTCGKRFMWQLGNLPYGYDHKYTYSRIGFNLKITDMQAALGLSQLDKLDSFVDARRRNFDRLKAGLSDLQDKLILPEPTKGSNPSWFGFLITLKPEAGMDRNEFVDKLTKNKIATRLLFAGDIRKQPYFIGREYRCIGDLPNTDRILNDTLWIGVTPMINDEMVDYMVEMIHKILQK
jgi:CDP-4-dehydro-6-deoxyglucose reductase, E1